MAKKISAPKTGMKMGLAAAAVAGLASAYFLYGSKDAAKNRKKAKGWMLKAKGEVLEQVEKLKEIDKEQFMKVVDTVTAKYEKLASAGQGEAQKLGAELKKHWKEIEKEVSGTKKVVKKAVKKMAKKV